MNYISGVKAINDEDIRAARWILFYGQELMTENSGDQKECCSIPFMDSISEIRSVLSDIIFLGHADGQEVYTAELSRKLENGLFRYNSLRTVYETIDNDWYWLTNRALHLLNWRKKNRYCGVCSNELIFSEKEVSLLCPKCGNIIYPKISPAVIVAITKGDKLLLAHSERFPKEMYSVIAGFLEAGETLEECVAREVGEEVGIKVKNVRYFGSQPWPYPDSFMIGFTAEYESGNIKIDDDEIQDARWFTKDSLPGLPLRASIARRLIDWFCREYHWDK